MSWDEAFADRYEEWSADMTVDTGWMDDSTRASVVAQQPTGRLGTPEDVANLVRFLLSPSGHWINGQLLYSNGGFPKGHLPL